MSISNTELASRPNQPGLAENPGRVARTSLKRWGRGRGRKPDCSLTGFLEVLDYERRCKRMMQLSFESRTREEHYEDQ
jgi:hypothetical protein